MSTIKPDYYTFNEHYNPKQMYYVLLNGQTFLAVYNRFKKPNKRVHVEDFEYTIEITTLKRFKRNWIDENINTVVYLKVIVGTKKVTTNLQDGVLIQLAKI